MPYYLLHCLHNGKRQKLSTLLVDCQLHIIPSYSTPQREIFTLSHKCPAHALLKNNYYKIQNRGTSSAKLHKL